MNRFLFSAVTTVAAAPLLGLGLLGQFFTGVSQGFWLSLLSLLALILGLGGLALSYSKLKHGLQIGAVLIIPSTYLSFLFEYKASTPNETYSLTMIIVGYVIIVLLAFLDLMVNIIGRKKLP